MTGKLDDSVIDLKIITFQSKTDRFVRFLSFLDCGHCQFLEICGILRPFGVKKQGGFGGFWAFLGLFGAFLGFR